MTNNTQFKTLVNTWLNQKKPMITPSTHASFTLIAENHLIPYFGKRKIGSITEADIQSYISYLYNAGRLDKTGGLTVSRDGLPLVNQTAQWKALVVPEEADLNILKD